MVIFDRFVKFVFRWFSGDPFEESGFSCVPPGAECELVFGEPDDDGKPMHIATTYNNDGFEVWIGYRNAGWLHFHKAEHARRLAWFILWDWWIVATWCGLKRKIWYWALRQEVKRQKRQVRQMQDAGLLRGK